MTNYLAMDKVKVWFDPAFIQSSILGLSVIYVLNSVFTAFKLFRWEDAPNLFTYYCASACLVSIAIYYVRLRFESEKKAEWIYSIVLVIVICLYIWYCFVWIDMERGPTDPDVTYENISENINRQSTIPTTTQVITIQTSPKPPIKSNEINKNDGRTSNGTRLGVFKTLYNETNPLEMTLYPTDEFELATTIDSRDIAGNSYSKDDPLANRCIDKRKCSHPLHLVLQVALMLCILYSLAASLARAY